MDDDLDWDELLMSVRDRRVVPVVGSEFLQVPVNGAMKTVESVLAADLSQELGLAIAVDVPTRLSDVAFRYLQAHGSPKRLYPKLKMVLDRRRFEVSPALKLLAEIREFPVVLTTSFTPLIGQALNQVRFAGRTETEVFAFTPYSKPGDFRPGVPPGAGVYHLFGMASSMPDYVITDEDLIEFMQGLQSERRPLNLFDYLRGRHLLFLGCGYTSWLARFFIRTLRNERFASGNPQKSEMVVDDAAARDPDLAVFLRQYDSRVFRYTMASDFVAELHARLRAEDGAARPSSASAPYLRAMTIEAVFLSYAREDLEHVRKLSKALESAGIDVWFDEQRLTGGVDWDALIQDNIRRCSLFVPLVSRSTERADEGYFRFEWQLALRRALRMAPTRPFVMPVSVDGTPSDAPNVPREFEQWQWAKMAETDDVDAIVAQIRKAVRLLRAPQYAQ